ncbi:hypothetical protein [Brevundimonas sp.]|uniref:hypothetical protein n=1 Tax=Brevundimonas sp. TaxID=1871086 RepID=UPI003D0CD500
MALARTLLLLLGAFGVLLLGAVSPAAASTETPPCHDMAGMTSDAPASSPERPMKSMACCVACIAAPTIVPPLRTGMGARPTLPQPALRVLPTGRRPSPDTGPPRA